MKTTIVLLFVITFVVIQSANAGFRPRSSYSYKESPSKTASQSSYMMSNDSRNERASAQTEAVGKKTSRGAGISAWGIIGIIMAAILIATTGYYAFVFYPFLCKKERNYDIIELTNVV